MRRILFSACLQYLFASIASSQITNATDTTSTPVPGVGYDYVHMLMETVNPANGSVSVRIQVPAPKGHRLAGLGGGKQKCKNAPIAA